jgi:hypothetical protein
MCVLRGKALVGRRLRRSTPSDPTTTQFHSVSAYLFFNPKKPLFAGGLQFVRISEDFYTKIRVDRSLGAGHRLLGPTKAHL